MSNQNKKSAKPQSQPKDMAVFDREIAEAYSKQQYEKAARIAREACKAFPESMNFPYLVAEMLLNDERRWQTPHLNVLEQIVQICDMLIGVVEENTESLADETSEKDYRPYAIRAFAFSRRGDGLRSEGKADEARDAFLESERSFMDALELDNGDWAVLYGYAETLVRLGTEGNITDESFVLAKERFHEAITSDETYGKAYITCSIGYAIVLMRNNETAVALETLNAALEHRPEDAGLLRAKDVAVRLLNPYKESSTANLNALDGFASKKQSFDRFVAYSPAKAPSTRPIARSDGPLKL